ncbi:hypothetical protein [Sporomusa acidovorans]|uniref:Uncharacterized protein n=1 Tax=Sporomusa acidovorans (strain ATCC 49682 / DSM 3132 / Mol) TaxID=1123286 RepID=A0ABZ3J5U7_SPOA4|nr:hypothetical protein [Sporomusa acidovorans]OZC16924.1 hypothetical protein SPACI_40250 [Sporomusa acidovorans DSM 3132]SDF75587.1 hypothetical protein SAMN04488499_107727 [Sporomusa acidovorans]
MFNSILNQAFEQYVLDRVDDILSIAGVADVKYKQVVKDAGAVLEKLMEIGRELEEQHPELLRLVMEYEAATNMESGLAAEIVYREGIRDSCRVRQEVANFMQREGHRDRLFVPIR